MIGFTFNYIFCKGIFIFGFLHIRLTNPYIQLQIPTSHISCLLCLLLLTLCHPNIFLSILRCVNPLHAIIIVIAFTLLVFSGCLRPWWHVSKLIKIGLSLFIPLALFCVGWKICNEHNLLAEGAL